jgi:peptidoglycan/xylan/chitin deacetylase (PgdA/CDA1 family)
MRTLILRLAQACGFFALCRWLTRGQLRILCYHGIWLGPPPHYGDRLFMSPKTFAQRMQMLARNGYRVLPLDVAMDRLRKGSLNARDVVITIDDGWQGTERHMLPELARLGFPATIYVPTRNVIDAEPVLPVLVSYLMQRAGSDVARQRVEALLPPPRAGTDPAALDDRLLDWLEAMQDSRAREGGLQRVGAALGIDVTALVESGAFSLMTPDALRRAVAAGIDVQLHTHGHSMHGMDATQLAHELRCNRAALAGILGIVPASFRHFCYPSGEHDSRAFPVLRADGVETATTTEFGLARRGDSPLALPRILDGESTSDIEFEARLSGFWSVAHALARWGRASPPPS